MQSNDGGIRKVGDLNLQSSVRSVHHYFFQITRCSESVRTIFRGLRKCKMLTTNGRYRGATPPLSRGLFGLLWKRFSPKGLPGEIWLRTHAFGYRNAFEVSIDSGYEVPRKNTSVSYCSGHSDLLLNQRVYEFNEPAANGIQENSMSP